MTFMIFPFERITLILLTQALLDKLATNHCSLKRKQRQWSEMREKSVWRIFISSYLLYEQISSMFLRFTNDTFLNDSRQTAFDRTQNPKRHTSTSRSYHGINFRIPWSIQLDPSSGREKKSIVCDPRCAVPLFTPRGRISPWISIRLCLVILLPVRMTRNGATRTIKQIDR